MHSSIPLALDWQGAAGFRAPRSEEFKDQDGQMPSLLMGGAMGAMSAMGGALQQRMTDLYAAGGDDPMNVCSHAAVMRSMMGNAIPAAAQCGHDAAAAQGWQPELFQGP